MPQFIVSSAPLMEGVLGPALWFYVVAFGVLTLVGHSAAPWLIPRSLRPYRLVIAPLLGWSLFTAAGSLLQPVIGFSTTVWLVVAAAGATLLLNRLAHRQVWPSGWQEAWPSWVIGASLYLLALIPHVAANTLTSLVIDTDAEFHAQKVALLNQDGLGWDLAAYALAPTPLGASLLYTHGLLATLAQVDAFTAALPSSYILLALSAPAVYLFARHLLGLGRGWAILGTSLCCLHGLPLWAAGGGWGKQAAAVAAAPWGLTVLAEALRSRERPAAVLGALGTVSFAASLSLVAAPILAMTLGLLVLGQFLAPGGQNRLITLRQAIILGGLVLAIGWGGHAQAVSALLSRYPEVGFDLADPRNVSVPRLPSLAMALGISPLDLVHDPGWPQGWLATLWPVRHGRPLLTGAVTVLAATLIALGALRALVGLRWREIGAVLAAFGGLVGYVYVLKPFPYGAFKVITTGAFLIATLFVMGCMTIASLPDLRVWARQRGPHGWSLPRMHPWRFVSSIVVVVIVALYGSGLAYNTGQSLHFCARGWGAALPPELITAAQEIAAAAGAGQRVLISGQYVYPLRRTFESNRWPAPFGARRTESGLSVDHWSALRTPFSQYGYLSGRALGLARHFLIAGGVEVYGLFRHQAADTARLAADGRYDYVVLGRDHPPWLYGLAPQDLVRENGFFRLFRAGRPQVLLADLAAARGSPDVTAERPLMLEVAPGRIEPIPADAPPSAALPSGAGRLVLGIMAQQSGRVQVAAGMPPSAPSLERQLLVEPGLIWYTTPSFPLPTLLTLTPLDGQSLWVVAAVLFESEGLGVVSPLAESFEEERLPTLAATVTRFGPDGAGLRVQAWYANKGDAVLGLRLVLRDSREAMTGGAGLLAGFDLDDPLRTWELRLHPTYEAPLQLVSGSPVPLAWPWPWPGDQGERWLRLEVTGVGEPPFLALPLAQVTVTSSGVADLTPIPAIGGATLIPFPVDPPTPPVVREGALLKGHDEWVYLVQDGRRHWVSSLVAFERLGRSWEEVRQLDDDTLWHIPQGLPLR